MSKYFISKNDPLRYWKYLQIDINKLHTTALRAERIKRNLGLDCDDVVAWCKQAILNATDEPKLRIGKNWYVYCDGIVLTINSTSNTIITAKKQSVPNFAANCK
jgi:hypothetical protein